MVRLDSADRDQRVGAGSDGVGNDVFELPQLVAAEREARIAVLPLGVDLDRAAQMPGQAFQSFDRRRTEGQWGIARIGLTQRPSFFGASEVLGACPQPLA